MASSSVSNTSNEQSGSAVLGAWSDYQMGRADLSDAAKDNYRRTARHGMDFAGDTLFTDLDLHDYLRHRRTTNPSPRTLAFEMTVLRMAFTWAKEEGLLPPTAFLRFPKVKVDPRRFKTNHATPTPTEVGRVLASMDNDDWRLALTVLARTGARIGEVAALCIGDVDIHRKRLSLGSTDGNSKTGLRYFPLDAVTLAALDGRTGPRDAPLFDFEGRADPRQALRRRLAWACRAAKVPEFTPHGLRRMVVGRLMRAGVDPGTAASLTGHSINVMLRLYQEVTDEDRQLAAEKAALSIFVEVSVN